VELPGPLVSPEWLADRLATPGLIVADVRWVRDGSSRVVYGSGHIAGAVFLDADDDLSAIGDGAGRHPLPSPEAFARTMERVGIDDETVVVAYDDAQGSYAARLWWMLDATGHRAALLDGGLGAWGGPIGTGPAATSWGPTTFTPRPWPAERAVGADGVAAAIESRSAVVLDARAGERYRGEIEPIDPVAGHILGARSAPWADNLDPATGRFLPAERLRARYEELGVRTGDDAIAYCGSGLTAAVDLLALRLAGFERDGRLYGGSWSGWIEDPSRPVAVGAEPHENRSAGSRKRSARSW
jgi:thiosulfate/3-mercaptopyruvate sulfurtransferase